MRKIGLLTAAALIIGLSVLPSSAFSDTAEKNEPCCFANPRYTGVCKVIPGEDETCSSILAYLNNLQSVGKAYCGNTPVRGGWAKVSCNPEEEATAAPVPACAASPDPSGRS